MAMTPVEQARVRKLIYAGLIILLFTGLVIFRQLGVVENAAERYGISETNIGKTDLGGSAARFLLASFRGPLICSLWWEAIELQRRHEWHEMEIIIKSLTKLQPHFRRPWEYQGWNLAYNVSVEFDRAQDKYFYIAEGIRFATEGEKINRALVYDPDNPSGAKRVVGDPDLRNSIGFFYQDKFSVSDEINTFRCYLPLSCIPPKDWDPYTFRQDPERLKAFKRENPQLVQRIRILKHIPEEAEAQLDEEIKNFTAALFRPQFPSLHPEQFQGAGTAFALTPAANLPRFPAWPEPDPEEAIPENLREALKNVSPEKPKSQDSYEIARLWFEYSNVPLPPISLSLTTLDAERRRLYRLPTRTVTSIFRSNPARSKGLMAMRLAREGWFKESREAWAEAFDMWRDHGRNLGLELEAEEYKALEERAQRFVLKFPDVARGTGAELPVDVAKDPEVQKDIMALARLRELESRRGVGNYNHWRVTSEAFMSPDGMNAWRHFYNAQNRFTSDLQVSRAEYEKGLECYRKLVSTDRMRAEVLLGLGSTGPNAAALVQSVPCFEPTPFGRNRQSLEEVTPIQNEYVKLRARCQAPPWVHASCDLWHVSQLLSRQSGSACALSGAVGCLPAPTVPIRLYQMQMILEMKEAPLDPYLDSHVLDQGTAANARLRPMQMQLMRDRMSGEEKATPAPQP